MNQASRKMSRLPLSVEGPAGLVFGIAPRPLTLKHGFAIGAGTVYPEVNFTLPPMLVDDSTWPEVLRQYRAIIAGILQRAAALELTGLVVEFEHLPPMTQRPARGAEITELLHEALERGHEKFGLKYAVRSTIVDLRDETRPPRLRSGAAWDAMLESWRLCARRGADILSIESVGGKEVHDKALMFGDVRGIAYSLGVLAPRDMEWLWTELVRAAEAERCVPGADSACGFANTAMQLAHQKHVPETLAAVVRAMSAVRSLVAFECGARGPSKDCAYEGPVMKAITGCPISMEGKSAACAHFSPIGNIASMAADLWSNESVQNVRLLSGSAPEAFLEILAYDCRLMNQATVRGKSAALRDLLVGSDELRSPQALVLGPDATFRIAKAIVAEADDYRRTLAAGRVALELIREASGQGFHGGRLVLSPQEERWLQRIERELSDMPDDPEGLRAEMAEKYGDLFDPASYGLD